jgi:phosphatidate cytidylyltransferase
LPTQPQKPNPVSKIPPGLARVLTALVLLPILIASFLIPSLAPLFAAIVGIALILALLEFWILAGKQQIRADPVAGFLGAAALFTIFYFSNPRDAVDFSSIVAVLVLLTICSLVATMLRGAPFERMLARSGVTVLGVMYVVFLGSHLVAIRNSFTPELSKDLLSFLLLVVMGSDAAAYYGGRAFGKHKLAPTVSPGKTWEGAVAGMLASLLLAAASYYWFFRQLPLKFALPLAAVMNVFGVLGDLTESALKRSVDTKDTARLLPGHGGMLDRIDSLLFTAPLIYYFAHLYFRP